MRALLFPVSTPNSTTVWLRTYTNINVKDFDGLWAEDYDISNWFSTGSIVKHVRLHAIPGVNFPLRNHYTVCYTLSRKNPGNECMRELGVQNIRGNVLVLRHAAKATLQVTHINACEKPLIELAVKQ